MNARLIALVAVSFVGATMYSASHNSGGLSEFTAKNSVRVAVSDITAGSGGNSFRLGHCQRLSSRSVSCRFKVLDFDGARRCGGDIKVYYPKGSDELSRKVLENNC